MYLQPFTHGGGYGYHTERKITADLDAETESRVLEALRHASRGRTVLSISHRVYESLGGRTVELLPQ